MGVFSLILFGAFAVLTSAYYPPFKESGLGDVLMREVMDKTGQDLENYLEDLDPSMNYLQLISRSYKDSDYQDSPSPRDHEYLQHSSLWANLMQGSNENEETGPQMAMLGNQKQLNRKQDNLPAYCNPPNPCPIGYTGEEGCLEEFENTASFSRDYQSQQECMCDTEHMFDCSASHMNNDLSQSDLSRIVQQFHVEDEHKSLVAKKFHVKKSYNPYLMGEKLPVAAKKGLRVRY
ncbi:neuroendocrine protein 7B2 [Cimex lectularius]|uniref:Neuroendocrine protein 7B2 n=1 Tax=Cimex lectularius TaxID=79782 RepID=A0A8I6S8F0_CIMLE|nr:neuroendocrine protein 7B2 [Cimex lectularius]